MKMSHSPVIMPTTGMVTEQINEQIRTDLKGSYDVAKNNIILCNTMFLCSLR